MKNVQVAITGKGDGNSEAADAGDELESGQGYQSSINTDEKGHFEFADVPAGAYYVRAAHTGMVMKGSQPGNAQLIRLQGGQSQNLNLIMLPGSAITGRVLNEEGEPMQNVSVAAMRYIYTIAGRQLMEAKRATSDDKGEYRLFSLKPGSYLLMADTTQASYEDGTGFSVGVGTQRRAGAPRQDQKIYAPTYYQNESSAEQAARIVLKPGEEIQANFALVRLAGHHISGKISGVVVSKSKDKAEQSRCFVMVRRPGSPFPVGFAVMGKDSTFDIGPIVPGKYTITAIEGQGESEGRTSGSRDVVVDSSDVTGVNISLHAGTASIHGMVRPEGDAKLDYSKLFVVLVPAGDTETSSEPTDVADSFSHASAYSEVSKDGSIKFEVVEPSTKPYQVVVTARGSGVEDWFTSKTLFGGKDVLESGFKIGDAEQRALEVVVSNKGALIEGTVLDAEKKPFANAEVMALPTDPRLRKRYGLIQKTTADQLGHFKIRGVRPGEYVVLSLEDAEEQPFMEDGFLKKNSAQAQTVKAEAGVKQKLELQIILSDAQ
ncbi:MAG TPA: carboxypeptidase-like regulatory domain-containing protein [Candidatus Angelobacter sp.]|nr:carboxypeptidase-like regulatory domain-containing protein [Candidatus Angelobacter sp.]